MQLSLRNLFIPLKSFSYESRKRLYADVPPELIRMKKGVDNFIQEKDFLDFIYHWRKNSALDVTYFATQLLDKIDTMISENEADKINKYMNSLYMTSNGYGGYTQTRDSDQPSVHSVHSAIGLVNIIHSHCNLKRQVKWHEPLGREKLIDYLEKDKVEQIVNFLQNCERDGGYAESPHSKIGPTINATSSVLWCFWHLDCLDICNYDSLLGFLEKHVVHEKNVSGEKIVGLKNHINDDYPWTCATYFTYRINRTLQTADKNLFKDFELDPESVIRFILDSQEEQNGIGARKGFKENIVHTKDALSLIKNKDAFGIDIDDYFEKKGREDSNKKVFIQKIESFLDECEFKGVYGFAERKNYMPNVYTTQLAIDIKLSLKQMKNENIDSIVNEIQKKEIIDFLNSCYNDNSGGYRGYSFSTDYVPDEWVI